MNPLTAARQLVLALILMVPHSPAIRCLRDRSERIAMALADAQMTREVPAAILLSTAFFETWVGCHANEGGGFGAPRDARHRHVAGTADDAARILQHSFAICGNNWSRASGRFRSGLCVPTNPVHRAYVARVIRFAERLSIAASVAVPEHLR